MASNYTTNYGLPIWAADDAFLRTEFNDANQKIDAALGTANIERFYVGSYTGDGTSSRTIQLSFAPKLLILTGRILSKGAITILTQEFAAYVTDSCGRDSQYNVVLEGDQLKIRHQDWNNQSGFVMKYIAIR